MPFTLPDLPYAYDALEPTIDARTMEIHHSKHHQAYVTNANNALAGTSLENASVDEVLKSLSSLPQDKQGPVRNNAGGHANHSLFWTILGPNGGGTPSGDLGSAIDSTFGGFDALKKQLIDAGVNRFGSGWSWLVVDGGNLKVTSTANQDSPISDGQTPILGIDVWEHAYYLNYQNRRPDYLEAIFNAIDWSAVSDRYTAARSVGAPA
jgi:Fe-Mn family superoxide dismutase